MGEDGLNEPLPVTLKIRGEKPDWTVDEALLQTNITMSIVGQVTWKPRGAGLWHRDWF